MRWFCGRVMGVKRKSVGESSQQTMQQRKDDSYDPLSVVPSAKQRVTTRGDKCSKNDQHPAYNFQARQPLAQ
jgi:hypothetical protein